MIHEIELDDVNSAYFKTLAKEHNLSESDLMNCLLIGVSLNTFSELADKQDLVKNDDLKAVDTLLEVMHQRVQMQDDLIITYREVLKLKDINSDKQLEICTLIINQIWLQIEKFGWKSIENKKQHYIDKLTSKI